MNEALHNANRHGTVDGPVISVPPLQAKVADSRPSCKNTILDAVERLRQQTGATQCARRDIVAEVQGAAGFERQTIYRCIRRMTGHEPGSAHHDLMTWAMASCVSRSEPTRDPGMLLSYRTGRRL